MANRNQYRGANGRFERCTVQKLFGMPTNEKGNKYRCSSCGYVFVPIIETGKCVKCRAPAVVLEKEA